MQGNKVTMHRSDDSGSTYGGKIADIIGLEPGERTSATVDSTFYGADHDYDESDYGLRSGGEWNLTIRYKDGQTDVEAMIDAFENGTKEYLQAQFPAPISKTRSFCCLVTKVGVATPKDGQIDQMITLKVSGKPTEGTLS